MLSFLLSPYLKLSNVCNMMLLQQMGYRTNEGKERKSESMRRQWKPPLSRGMFPTRAKRASIDYTSPGETGNLLRNRLQSSNAKANKSL